MKSLLRSFFACLLVAGWVSSSVDAAPPDAPQNLRVIIRFNNAPGKAERDLVRGAGGTVHASFDIVPAVSATIPEAALQNPALEHSPVMHDV